jgi:hypothetical protein
LIIDNRSCRQSALAHDTANCIIIAQTLHFSLLFSGAVLQIALAQSDF